MNKGETDAESESELVALGSPGPDEEAARLEELIEIDDGSEANPKTNATDYDTALKTASPDRDFPPRSNDDVYIIYTGGTTGYPKGVMWRHEDIYRVLFGGTDFATGEFIKDEYDLAKGAAANPPMVRHPIPPMIHGATQSATWMSIFSGQTTVLSPEFNADEVWRTIHDHKVNLLFFTGDAMARPLLDALLAHQDEGTKYDLSSLFLLASTAALFSPSIKERLLELQTMLEEGSITEEEYVVEERQVLAEVGSGLSNTEIAALLHISEATVKTHVGHIMAKLGLRDRIQAVVYAYETGLVRPGAGNR